MTQDRCARAATACIVAALLSAGIEAQADDPDDDDDDVTTISVVVHDQRYRLALQPPTGQRRSNVIYVRWSTSQPRELETFLPLPRDHPAFGEQCLWCGEPLGNGELVQLFAVGATTKRDRIAHYLGLEYSAMAAYGHGVCVSGEPPPYESTQVV